MKWYASKVSFLLSSTNVPVILKLPILFLSVGVIGVCISATVILSLISIYIPNHATGSTCPISFFPMLSQFVGRGPTAIRAAHLDNDCFLDIVVANYDEGSAIVLFGLGNGSFSRQITIFNQTNAGTNGIAIGLINNDTHMDIVLANRNASNVQIYYGDGYGGFSTSEPIATGTNSNPVEVALSDINNDTYTDIVVVAHVLAEIQILLQNADGSFQNAIVLPTGNGSGPYFLSIHDFNRDQHADIAVGKGEDNTLSIFFGNGTGHFSNSTNYNMEPGSYALTVNYFNRDDILDIVTGNYDDGSTTILFGNSDGTFTKQKRFSTGVGSLPYAIDSNDFNKDHAQDVIVANSGTNNIGIMLGNGNGNFLMQKTFATGANSEPRDVITGDFNGDNRIDFISANYRQNSIGIFLSTCYNNLVE
ncbi:unnamed protein product [Adineta ricciae]|uniref:VCBS repeat-containing protein n=3 Tax=Adineta ricciae TaxID=249248 RepID=A0A815IFL1_ADIRI|nr:unnamed protein product [Adineta ricciae]